MDSLKNEKSSLELLKELDQTHIIELYNKSSTFEKQELINQIELLETSYPGGIREYCKRAKMFLEASKNNENPYKMYKPSVPEGVNIDIGTNINCYYLLYHNQIITLLLISLYLITIIYSLPITYLLLF